MELLNDHALQSYVHHNIIKNGLMALIWLAVAIIGIIMCFIFIRYKIKELNHEKLHGIYLVIDNLDCVAHKLLPIFAVIITILGFLLFFMYIFSMLPWIISPEVELMKELNGLFR